MGNSDDAVNKAISEMREKIDAATDRFHDARDWFDRYYAGEDGRTVGDRLIEDLLEIASRYGRSVSG